MERRSFSRALAVPLTLVTVFAFGACGSDDNNSSSSSSTSGSDGPKTIAVNQYTRDIPYFQEMLKGIQQEADKLGWKVEATFANTDPTQQINQIQNAITKKPDAMIVVPIDENAIVPPMRAAKNAGVPVMTMGDNVAESGRDAQLLFLGVDYTDLGKEKANLIVDELGGKGSVGWIHGIRGINFDERQIKGATPVFEAAPGIKVVDGPYAGAFSSDAGLKATENLLSRNSNLDAMLFSNDDIALGGIQAIKEKGLKDVFTVGTDGGPAALDAVKKGDLDVTISLCGFAQGVQAMEVLKKYLVDGEKPPPEIITKTLEFTKESYDEAIKQVESGAC